MTNTIKAERDVVNSSNPNERVAYVRGSSEAWAFMKQLEAEGHAAGYPSLGAVDGCYLVRYIPADSPANPGHPGHPITCTHTCCREER